MTQQQFSNQSDLEERKRKEIDYYDKKAKEILKSEDFCGDFEGFNPLILSSFSYLYYLVNRYCPGKKVLDYGCGNGIHSIFLAKQGADVTAIDLSRPSLKIAKKRMIIEGGGLNKINFLEMDCENLDFEDNFFDVVFDGGTFSSLDFKKAIAETQRVLKPNGKLICIETFGHNPLGNLKRKINKKIGKRTEWATQHILKNEDIDFLKNKFDKVETKHFHFLSSLFIPLLNNSIFRVIFKIIDSFERMTLLQIPFLKKYGFKVVILCSDPKK